MKKLLYTFLLIGYIFSVSSLTHVFAMTDILVQNNAEQPVHHGCGHEISNDTNEESQDKSENSMDCCELLFSSEFEYISIDKTFLLDNQNNFSCGYIYETFDKIFENIKTKEVFSPPGREDYQDNLIKYHNLIGIIKDLN